jgi:hypothetical protein
MRRRPPERGNAEAKKEGGNGAKADAVHGAKE